MPELTRFEQNKRTILRIFIFGQLYYITYTELGTR